MWPRLTHAAPTPSPTSAAHAAPAAPTRAQIHALFDDVMLASALEEVDDLLHAIGQAGRAPDFASLSALHGTLRTLKEDLYELTREEHGDLAQRVYRHADQRTPPANAELLAAPLMRLARLYDCMQAYRRSDERRRLELTPVLHAALENYLDLMSLRQYQAEDGDHAQDLERHHERLRRLLEEPQRQRIIRRNAAQLADAGTPDLYARLGIGRDYRSTPADREAFRALFLSGRIIRTRGRYAPPKECAELLALYTRQIREAMQRDHLPGACLDDLLAVRTYTVSSNELNQALREDDQATIDRFAPYIRLLVSGLRQLHGFPRGVRLAPGQFATLYRGVELSQDELLARGYVPGNVLRYPSPMSCSDGRQVSYCQMTDKYNVQFTVRARSARYLGEVSLHAQNESESLFAPLTWFRVISVTWREAVGAPGEPPLPGRRPGEAYPRVDIVLEEMEEAGARAALQAALATAATQEAAAPSTPPHRLQLALRTGSGA